MFTRVPPRTGERIAAAGCVLCSHAVRAGIDCVGASHYRGPRSEDSCFLEGVRMIILEHERRLGAYRRLRTHDWSAEVISNVASGLTMSCIWELFKTRGLMG